MTFDFSSLYSGALGAGLAAASVGAGICAVWVGCSFVKKLLGATGGGDGGGSGSSCSGIEGGWGGDRLETDGEHVYAWGDGGVSCFDSTYDYDDYARERAERDAGGGI